MRLIFFFFFLSIQLTIASDPVPSFHKVAAKTGDGVFSLLRRYDLLGHQCNVDKFYELNQLDHKSSLLQGKSYFLPILLYKYNGKSIRSTIKIEDWDLATRIADFNNSLHSRNLRNKTYQSSTILWVPFHELNCNTSHVVKVNANMVHMPLFGPKYADVPIKSSNLKGKVYYIVSGHGGPDPGAMAKYSGKDLCEDEYAYDVSLRLARNLIEHGATVHMIIQDPDDGIRSDGILECDRDEMCIGKYEIPLVQITRLKQRTEVINKLYHKNLKAGIKDQTVVCIHVDSRSPQKRQDVFFYYYGKSNSGKQVASNLHQTFKNKYKKFRSNGAYHGTVSSRGLYMLRHTDPKAVYVELANIRNSVDLKRIMPEENRQALANWLYEGLTR